MFFFNSFEQMFWLQSKILAPKQNFNMHSPLCPLENLNLVSPNYTLPQINTLLLHSSSSSNILKPAPKSENSASTCGSCLHLRILPPPCFSLRHRTPSLQPYVHLRLRLTPSHNKSAPESEPHPRIQAPTSLNLTTHPKPMP